jgi:hypothetical protein
MRPTVPGLSVSIIAGLLCLVGCGGSPSSPTPTPPLPTPTDPPASTAMQLQIGGRTFGVIEAPGRTCSYTVDGTLLKGPCKVYYILGPGRGSVNVTLTWTTRDDLTLAVGSGTGDFLSSKAVCCRSPLQIAAPLFIFDVTPIGVVYTGHEPLTANRTIPFDLSAGPFVPAS